MNQLTADGDLARAFASVRDALAGARFALLGRENFNPFEPGAAPMKAFRVVRKS